jgi:hypothetical protein
LTFRAFSSAGLEHYLDKVGVTGSNPVMPTQHSGFFEKDHGAPVCYCDVSLGQMRAILIILSVLVCGSCDDPDKFTHRVFQLDELTLLRSIDSLYEQNPQYKPPAKWTIYDSYSQRGNEFSKERKFYFPSPVDEMYSVRILKFDKETKIIISAIFSNNGWQLENDLTPNEIMRIEKGFDDRIISKLEMLTNSTCRKED